MSKRRLFETATTATVAAGAALAAPAAAHHDTRDCSAWMGAPVHEQRGVARVEAETLTLFDMCPASPGVEVELADGSRVRLVARQDSVHLTREARPTPQEQQAPAARQADGERSQKKRPRCKKRNARGSSRRCRSSSR